MGTLSSSPPLTANPPQSSSSFRHVLLAPITTLIILAILAIIRIVITQCGILGVVSGHDCSCVYGFNDYAQVAQLRIGARSLKHVYLVHGAMLVASIDLVLDLGLGLPLRRDAAVYKGLFQLVLS